MDEMGLAAVRRPGAVPDTVGGADIEKTVVGGADTDGDGVPDTVLTADGADLLVQTDLDTDGLVDRVLRIGLDGVVCREPDDPVVGSAPAAWPGLLGRLFGPDP
jgi:hypothetical protein